MIRFTVAVFIKLLFTQYRGTLLAQCTPEVIINNSMINKKLILCSTGVFDGRIDCHTVGHVFERDRYTDTVA